MTSVIEKDNGDGKAPTFYTGLDSPQFDVLSKAKKYPCAEDAQSVIDASVNSGNVDFTDCEVVDDDPE